MGRDLSRTLRAIISALLFSLSVTVVQAKTVGPTLRDERLFACHDDIERFCRGSAPDKQKLKTCLRPNKAVVSAKCRAWLNVPE